MSECFTIVTVDVTSIWPSARRVADRDGQISSFFSLLAHVAGKDLRSLLTHTMAGSSKAKIHDVSKSAWKLCYSTLPETLKHSLWVASKLKGQIPSAHDDKLPQLTTLLETQPLKRSLISHLSANGVTCTKQRRWANKSRLIRKPSGAEMPGLPRYIQRSGLIFPSISYDHRDVEGTMSKNSLSASIYRTHKAKPQIHFSHKSQIFPYNSFVFPQSCPER